MLNSGERQVAPTIDGVRRDHVARYEWAAKLIQQGSKAIDLACGIGYGSLILAENGINVLGIDRDEETIAYANQHYKHETNAFFNADLSNGVAVPEETDAAVCFEAIEHIEDPRPLLMSLCETSSMLIASVPNEDVFPWKNYAFHYRHYTKKEFTLLLNECGWEPVEWYGQEGPESEVEPDINGRTIIAVCRRMGDSDESQKYSSKHVTILGLGPSLEQYVDIAKRLGGKHAYCDEVWGINAVGGVIQCDLVFHMDDVRIQEKRAQAKPESNIARMLEWMRVTNIPIITSRKHENYPTLVEFPLEDAMNELKHDYFNSTAAYAVAFAIMMGVERISLFGCDYTYPNAHDAEKGRACVEFWLGIATERGIKITLPKSTSLMDAINSTQERLYGYDTLSINIKEEDNGRLRIEATDKEQIPTAEEIEERYDHSAHPNALLGSEK